MAVGVSGEDVAGGPQGTCGPEGAEHAVVLGGHA